MRNRLTSSRLQAFSLVCVTDFSLSFQVGLDVCFLLVSFDPELVQFRATKLLNTLWMENYETVQSS